MFYSIQTHPLFGPDLLHWSCGWSDRSLWKRPGHGTKVATLPPRETLPSQSTTGHSGSKRWQQTGHLLASSNGFQVAQTSSQHTFLNIPTRNKLGQIGMQVQHRTCIQLQMSSVANTCACCAPVFLLSAFPLATPWRVSAVQPAGLGNTSGCLDWVVVRNVLELSKPFKTTVGETKSKNQILLKCSDHAGVKR